MNRVVALLALAAVLAVTALAAGYIVWGNASVWGA
jgi:hypothetical protein